MASRPYLLHALSPLHAGTGHAADVVDLPIARMKATGIPFAPGSSIKGVLRDARKPASGGANDAKDKWFAAFGPDKDNASEHAGALVVGDARLLALPVRSFKGTFAWVTSPLLLRLALRDLGKTEADYPIPHDLVPHNAVAAGGTCIEGAKIYLQDLDIPATTEVDEKKGPKKWAKLIKDVLFSDGDYFTSRFAIVDEETMTFLWETATQFDQRVRINEKTRTVDKGALWLEESLPPETILIGLMEADKSRKGGTVMEPGEVLNFALPKPVEGKDTILQFGGKASVGRGRCRLCRVDA